MDSLSPYNYFLYLFKLDNLNTLLSVLNIINKVLGDICKMCDKYVPNLNIQKFIKKRNLEAANCSCGCFRVSPEQIRMELNNNKDNHSKKEMD